MLVEVKRVQSQPFVLYCSICQGCPLSRLLYVLAMDHFLRKLKASSVLRGIYIPVATTAAKYYAYSDLVSFLLSRKIEIDEVSKGI